LFSLSILRAAIFDWDGSQKIPKQLPLNLSKSLKKVGSIASDGFLERRVGPGTRNALEMRARNFCEGSQTSEAQARMRKFICLFLQCINTQSSEMRFMSKLSLDYFSSKELFKDVLVRLVNGEEVTLNYFKLRSEEVANPSSCFIL
jgi:hypothetical protein